MMRTNEADILIVPGDSGSDPHHWLWRWERKLSTAKRVEIDEAANPAERRARLIAHAKAAKRPVVLVAHDCGVIVAVQAAPHLAGTVRGAFLVAPPDLEVPYVAESCRALAPVPRDPLPFPSFLVGSRTDPYCGFEFVQELAAAWRSFFVDAGTAGHIDNASGHGPWPEGLLLFSRLLKNIAA